MITLVICNYLDSSVKEKRLKARFCFAENPTVFEIMIKKNTATDPISLAIEIPTSDIIRMAKQAGYTVTKKGS